MTAILPAVPGGHNRVEFRPFGGGPSRTIVVEAARDLAHIDWLPTGERFFSVETTPGRNAWLFVRPDGTSHVLWRRPGLEAAPIIPSPDGRHLAINAYALQGNAWLLTDF